MGIQHLFNNPELFLVLVPVQIYNFIETMNNVESAEAGGDKYPVGVCQVTDGVGTMIGGVFGSPFPTTVYIGHPAYKRMHARSGYALGVGIVFMVGALFGLVAFLADKLPEHTSPTVAGAAFTIGMMLFSGSLYTMTLTGTRWLGAITPIGGVALLIGWGAVVAGALAVR